MRSTGGSSWQCSGQSILITIDRLLWMSKTEYFSRVSGFSENNLFTKTGCWSLHDFFEKVGFNKRQQTMH